MATGLPPSSLSEQHSEDTNARQWEEGSYQHEDEQASPSTDNGPAQTPTGSKPSPTVQKRRRVTRACDVCRQKKIKCDGKSPCTHCTVYSYGQSSCPVGYPSEKMDVKAIR